MANSGINKVQVKKARDALIAKGKHPSIDAVRIELGNTGSKGTIHKYLVELGQESGVALGGNIALGDKLAAIVADLANQLQDEAQTIVKEASDTHQAEIKRLNDRLSEHQKLLQTANQQQEILGQLLKEAEAAKELLVKSEQEFALKAERLGQQLQSQEELIAQKDAHVMSLDEKHLHAREALEHYRTSVKDQRDQDQRRHEHQVQQLQGEIRQLNQTISIKQTDITQLNKDNSRLATELSETRKQLRLSEQNHQALTAQLGASEDALVTMTARFIESEKQQRVDAAAIKALEQQVATLQQASQLMQVELITVKTELSVKNQLFESLQPRLPEVVNQ